MIKGQSEAAYPGPSQLETCDSIHEGISVHDYFAARAMQGLVADSDFNPNIHAEAVAKHAFEIADAMIEQRKKGA